MAFTRYKVEVQYNLPIEGTKREYYFILEKQTQKPGHVHMQFGSTVQPGGAVGSFTINKDDIDAIAKFQKESIEHFEDTFGEIM